MKTIDYNEDELAMLAYIEDAQPESVPNLAEQIEQLKIAVKEKLSKRETVNLQILESDAQQLKTEANKQGIAYQKLIDSILHQYVQGHLLVK